MESKLWQPGGDEGAQHCCHVSPPHLITGYPVHPLQRMTITSVYWASQRCHPPCRQPGHPSRSGCSLFCHCLCVVSCTVSSGKSWRQMLLKFGHRVDMPLTLAQQWPTLGHTPPASGLLSEGPASPTRAVQAPPVLPLRSLRAVLITGGAGRTQGSGTIPLGVGQTWAQRVPHPRSAQHVPAASPSPQSPGPKVQKTLLAG